MLSRLSPSDGPSSVQPSITPRLDSNAQSYLPAPLHVYQGFRLPRPTPVSSCDDSDKLVEYHLAILASAGGTKKVHGLGSTPGR